MKHNIKQLVSIKNNWKWTKCCGMQLNELKNNRMVANKEMCYNNANNKTSIDHRNRIGKVLNVTALCRQMVIHNTSSEMRKEDLIVVKVEKW